jgi:hypothetical protein
VPAGAVGLGDLLLALVDGARRDGLDAEASLRAAVRRWSAAVRAGEQGGGQVGEQAGEQGGERAGGRAGGAP